MVATEPTRFTYPASDGVEIVGYRWDPAGTPRGAVQITHGMGEHVRRYDAVARAFTDRGLVVYGQDHRGHGATARSAGELRSEERRVGKECRSRWSPYH